MGYFSAPTPLTGTLGGYSGRQYGFVPARLPEEKPQDIGSFVQRPDLNNAFGTGVNIAVAAGRAPGYVAERPLAWANTLTKGPGQEKGIIDQITEGIKGVPFVGAGLGMIGDAISTPWAAKIMNSQTAGMLQATYGLSDDTVLPYNSAAADPLAGLPIIGGLFGTADVLNGGSVNMTVGELRQQAMRRGFTQQDIEDLHAGTKGTFDFGDVAVHENPLFNLGAQLALDPTNLAFGVGSVAKLGMGAKLFSRFFTLAGKEAPAAFEAWTFGRNLANDWHLVPYKGFAEKVAALGRGTSIATKAYFRTSLATTGAELAITGLDGALGDNTPISPLLEPLADFAKRAQADQPLSKGNLFSLISALKFPYKDSLDAVRGRLHTTRYSVTGSDIIPSVVRELAPEAKTFKAQMKVAAEGFQGGEKGVYQFAEWAVRSLAAEKVQRYFNLIKPDSQPALDAFAAWGDKEITRISREMLERGEVNGAQVVERMKEIATNARQVGDFGSGVRFPWMPKMVAQVFSQFQTRVSELAQMFDNRAPVVLKMLQDLPLPVEHIQILRGSLESLAEANGGVIPRIRMAEILHDYPQLLRDEPFKTQLARYIIPDGPETIAIEEVSQLLKDAEKTARPLNEYLYEFRDWEARYAATMPKVRSFDPITRRWSKDAAMPVGEVRVIAPSFMQGRARSIGLKAQTYDDVAALRGDAATQWFEDAAPKALDQSGFNVQAVTQTVMHDAGRGELLPHVEVTLVPEPKSWADAAKIGAALIEGGAKKVAKQGDYFVREMSGRMAGAVGLTPNAWRLRWQFGRLTAEQSEALVQLARRTGGNFDDHRSAFEIWDHMDDADTAEEVAQAIARAVPENPAVGRLMPSREQVYVQKVVNDARGSVGGADEVLSNVRREAATDPRYVSAATYLADSRRAAGLPARPRSTSLRQSWKPGAAGVGGEGYSADAARRVGESWSAVEAAVNSGADAAPAVDGFLAALHENVAPSAIPDALAGLRTAVETRSAGNPVPPALDDALLRANEDLVASGGNLGQVIFNAKLDAAADSILPAFDKSLADAPLELKQKLAEYQRQLVIENPAYTVSLPPTGEVPLIWSNNVGSVISDFSKPRPEWLQNLFDGGPISKLAQFQRVLFAPRKAFAAADAAKQELYNLFLQHGATVSEVNGYVNVLRGVADLIEIRGAKVFRSYDALLPSVFEKVALGKPGSALKGTFRIEFDPKAGGFNGFSQKVIDSVGEGNFYKLVDKASSGWWRNASTIARGPGKAGEVGRMLTALYPKGMGLRHYAKIWYHVFRFMSDPRWWALNSFESEAMFLGKYGVNVKGAAKYEPSTFAKMHTPDGIPAGPGLALDAAASGLYDNRSTLGAINKVFDVDAPRSTQRFLDSLPDADPIIKLMVEKHGLETRGTWGQNLLDDIEALDTRGAKATVVDEAKKIWAADEYAQMEQAGVLQRVWELNEQRMKDISQTLRGNPSRNLAERLMNSYWLYWPISYQLKAGKWLYDILTHRMFGNKTNLGGAYLLSHMVDKHEELLKQDPNYVAMFEDNPETWFFAQMFVPITPFDLSVSLSPAAKSLGGVLGLWDKPDYANNPYLFAARLATIGPVFSTELLKRIGSEQDPLDTVLRPFHGESGAPN